MDFLIGFVIGAVVVLVVVYFQMRSAPVFDQGGVLGRGMLGSGFTMVQNNTGIPEMLYPGMPYPKPYYPAEDSGQMPMPMPWPPADGVPPGGEVGPSDRPIRFTSTRVADRDGCLEKCEHYPDDVKTCKIVCQRL